MFERIATMLRSASRSGAASPEREAPQAAHIPRLPLRRLAVLLAMATIPAWPALAGEDADAARSALASGNWKAAETDFAARLAKDEGNDEARFGLGMVQFARAIENFGKHHHRYGLNPRQQVPFMRLPVPVNPSPEAPTYEIQRAALQTLLDDLAQAEATLGKMQGKDVKIHLDLEKVQLDFNSKPGAASQERTTLMNVVRAMNPRVVRRNTPASETVPFEVAFDRADALWLQGYCHLLSAGLEAVLAYDWRQTFDKTAGLFYPRLKLSGESTGRGGGFGGDEFAIADAIALVHEIRWQPVEPQRLLKVRDHLKQVIVLSRQSWQVILAETDDEQEWIPGPAQKNAAMPTMQITQQRVDTWLAALDEFDAVLGGRKLIPHWRFQKGINLRRVLEEPQAFDLVLWASGHAAMPYLEQGPIITSETWRSWETVFGGNFLLFAVYLN